MLTMTAKRRICSMQCMRRVLTPGIETCEVSPQLARKVPTGATTGAISITTAGATSAKSFKVTRMTLRELGSAFLSATRHILNNVRMREEMKGLI
jgi:hypothetical protein